LNRDTHDTVFLLQFPGSRIPPLHTATVVGPLQTLCLPWVTISHNRL
jgi:hypothetical protein